MFPASDSLIFFSDIKAAQDNSQSYTQLIQYNDPTFITKCTAILIHKVHFHKQG